MTELITTIGAIGNPESGLILPHEHIFVDLRTWDTPGYAQAESADVIGLMSPEITKAQAAGVIAIVESSTIGVGRRADIDEAVSIATKMPLIVPTGFYREPWIPNWAHNASQSEVTELMLKELILGIDGSSVKAGWIKLSAGDDGLTDCEKKILRAAAIAGKETNSVIGSHTIRGKVVKEQVDIIEAAGYSPERFIWIHTQAEPNFSLHLEMAARGIWLEYDWIGNPDFMDDRYYIQNIQNLLDAGYGDQILLSQDRGWYDPALPGGGVPKPYTYLVETFLPKLEASGVERTVITKITEANPFRAFAR